MIPAVNVMSWCCAVPKFSVTTVFAAGDDAVVLIPPEAIVIVETPAEPVVTVAPDSKLITVSDVPLEVPPSFNSIPETTPSKLLPSP